MSPTQRSLAYLKKLGYRVAIVEKFNIYAKVRIDLFGFIDLVAIRKGETVGVQTTSGSNISSHRQKILACPHFLPWKEAGNKVLLLGWSKKGARGKRKLWTPSEEWM